MAGKTGYDFFDATGNIITLGGSSSSNLTLTNLASSATAAKQSAAVTYYATTSDSKAVLPRVLRGWFQCKLTTGTLANDRTVYLYHASLLDETGSNYGYGPPAVGTTDTGFTFTNSPVGTSPYVTQLKRVAQLQFDTANIALGVPFSIPAPPPKGVFIVLNYSGIALTGTAADHFITLRKIWDYVA